MITTHHSANATTWGDHRRSHITLYKPGWRGPTLAWEVASSPSGTWISLTAFTRHLDIYLTRDLFRRSTYKTWTFHRFYRRKDR